LDLIVGYEHLGQALGDKHPRTVQKYVQDGLLPPPHVISRQCLVRTRAEIEAAISRLPVDPCQGRESE